MVEIDLVPFDEAARSRRRSPAASSLPAFSADPPVQRRRPARDRRCRRVTANDLPPAALAAASAPLPQNVHGDHRRAFRAQPLGDRPPNSLRGAGARWRPRPSKRLCSSLAPSILPITRLAPASRPVREVHLLAEPTQRAAEARSAPRSHRSARRPDPYGRCGSACRAVSLRPGRVDRTQRDRRQADPHRPYGRRSPSRSMRPWR